MDATTTTPAPAPLAPLDLPKRRTRRVRLDLDTRQADKLAREAKSRGLGKAAFVEALLDQLP